MGDMADYVTEQGFDNKSLHDAGMCDSFCEYCMEEWEKEDPKGFEKWRKELLRRR